MILNQGTPDPIREAVPSRICNDAVNGVDEFTPRRWPLYPIYVATIIMLATLLRLPMIGAPFESDDYSLIAAIERGEGRPAPLMNSKYQLWAFYDGQPAHTAAAVFRGALPWWTAPKARLALLRPLSSVVLTAIHAGAGWQPRAYHVATLAAFLLSLVAAAAVLRRVMPPPLAALATLLFSVHSVHEQSSNWISAIHLPLSTTLAMFALYAHIRWREGGGRPLRWLSIFLFAAALSAGEVALAALPFFVAYELSTRPQRAAWIRVLAPTIVLAGTYLIAYAALGYGARGIGYYVSPIEGDYWRGARVIVLALQLFAQTPPWMSGQLSDGRLSTPQWFFVACPVILLAAGRRAGSDRTGKLTLYCGVGLVLSALPALGGPSPRGLFLTSIGTSAVIALLLSSGIRIWRLERNVAWHLTLTVALVGTATAHLASALLTTAVSAQQFRKAGETELEKYAAIRPRDPESTDVILLNADDEASAVWGGVISKLAGSGELRAWRALSRYQGAMALQRTAVNAFQLDAMTAGFDIDAYRDPRRYPFRPGDRVATDALTIEVKEVKDGRPAVIGVEFDRPLDDPSLYFVARTPGGFLRIAMPPIGDVLHLGSGTEPTAADNAIRPRSKAHGRSRMIPRRALTADTLYPFPLLHHWLRF